MNRERGPLTEITIRTRTPAKWLFVDTETKEVWKWTDDGFRYAVRPGSFTLNQETGEEHS